MLMRQVFYSGNSKKILKKKRESINAFPAKQRWMTIWQEWKKSNTFIDKTKNRLENLKHDHVP